MAIEARDMRSCTSASMASFRGVGIATSDCSNGPLIKDGREPGDHLFAVQTKSLSTGRDQTDAQRTLNSESLPRQAPFGITPLLPRKDSHRDLRSLALKLSIWKVAGFGYRANQGLRASRIDRL